jgi:hypothetical protein
MKRPALRLAGYVRFMSQRIVAGRAMFVNRAGHAMFAGLVALALTVPAIGFPASLAAGLRATPAGSE